MLKANQHFYDAAAGFLRTGAGAAAFLAVFMAFMPFMAFGAMVKIGKDRKVKVKCSSPQATLVCLRGVQTCHPQTLLSVLQFLCQVYKLMCIQHVSTQAHSIYLHPYTHTLVYLYCLFSAPIP